MPYGPDANPAATCFEPEEDMEAAHTFAVVSATIEGVEWNRRCMACGLHVLEIEHTPVADWLAALGVNQPDGKPRNDQ